MPFINTLTSAPLPEDKEKRIAAAYGRAIENFPGKTEDWLMLNFASDAHIRFRGDDSEPSAMVEIKIFGKAPRSAYDAMTRDVCAILERELGVPGDRIYVKYEECDKWGWNGSNF